MAKYNGPKILFVDIETSPSVAYIWRLWAEVTSTEMLEKTGYILCWSAKWLHENKMHSDALINHPEYKTNPENDKEILKGIWKLLDEADIVIGHNLAEFDNKQLNTAFLKHGMTPPSPYKIVDTLIVAKKHFSFLSNKLADLGKFLGVGGKLDTGGFKLWKDCLLGSPKAWKHMIKYNQKDVTLLEKIYKKLLPYIENHPHCGAYIDDDAPHCTNCGSDKLQKRGIAFSNSGKYHRLQCQDCGAWMRLRLNIASKTKVKLTCR